MMRAAMRSGLTAARRFCCTKAPLPMTLTTREAPAFEAAAVVNGEITKVSLEDYLGDYLVLFFYPLDFTFVCPTEITAFNDRAKEFEEVGCSVAAVSVDSEYSHLAWSNTPRSKGGLGETQIPLISDLDKSISRNYGVLFNDSIALRGLFIIDRSGVVRSSIVNDLPVGRSVDETLRLVKAFKYTDENDDVMPCNWEPGQATMKADPIESQEYFSKNA